MIALLDTVILLRDRPDLGLSAGQVGAVVHVLGDDAFEVEFPDRTGQGSVLVALVSADLSAEPVGKHTSARRRSA